jgi:hypothetical protein
MHRVDAAQREREEERKPTTVPSAETASASRCSRPGRGAAHAAGTRRRAAAANAARPAVTKNGGSCGSAAGPTASRVIGKRHREDDDAEQAERETLGLAAAGRGGEAVMAWIPGQCRRPDRHTTSTLREMVRTAVSPPHRHAAPPPARPAPSSRAAPRCRGAPTPPSPSSSPDATPSSCASACSRPARACPRCANAPAATR